MFIPSPKILLGFGDELEINLAFNELNLLEEIERRTNESKLVWNYFNVSTVSLQKK